MCRPLVDAGTCELMLLSWDGKDESLLLHLWPVFTFEPLSLGLSYTAVRASWWILHLNGSFLFLVPVVFLPVA